ARLVVEAARAQALGACPVALVRVIGEDEEGDVWRRLAYRAQHVEAVAFLEVQVEHYRVGPRSEDALDRFPRAFGVTHGARAHRGDERDEALAQQRRVLD